MRHTIKQKIPTRAKSLQLQNGDLYVIGGMSDNHVLQDCFSIDKNMQVKQRAKMMTPRFGSPLALVHNRFILALGGFSRKNEAIVHCEAYDTVTNYWFGFSDLPFNISNTTPVVMGGRSVYLMPGQQTKKNQVPRCLIICVLDCGDKAEYTNDPKSIEFGMPLALRGWDVLEVTNPEFIKACPVAGIQLNAHEMMIFGGESNKTFIFNT